MEAVDGFGRERHGRVEAEAARGADDVVVDGLGHAHDRNALQIELVSNGQRPVAADDDERIEAHLLEGLDYAIGIVCLPNRGRVLEGISLVRGAEDCAPQSEDPGDVMRCQAPRTRGVEQAIEAVFEADHLHAGVAPRLDHRAYDRVEAGGVAAAGEDANLAVFCRHELMSISTQTEEPPICRRL